MEPSIIVTAEQIYQASITIKTMNNTRNSVVRSKRTGTTLKTKR